MSQEHNLKTLKTKKQGKKTQKYNNFYKENNKNDSTISDI